METFPEGPGPRPAQPVVPHNMLNSPAASVPPDRERRRDHRRPATVKATLTILDGASAGASHEVHTRDLSSSGVSFLLREGLAVGQTIKLTVQNGRTQSYLAEVVRSRPLSSGKHEMAVQFRRSA